MIKNFKNRGIATLPTVIVVGLMALAVVVGITSMSFNELLISQSSSQSSVALFYAEAGARDALIRIARNKNYKCDGDACYELSFATNECPITLCRAEISISDTPGTTAMPIVIVSKGYKGVSTRRVQVTVILDNGTTTASLQNGEITSAVWTELTN